MSDEDLKKLLHDIYLQGWNDGVKAGVPYEEAMELTGEAG